MKTLCSRTNTQAWLADKQKKKPHAPPPFLLSLSSFLPFFLSLSFSFHFFSFSSYSLSISYQLFFSAPIPRLPGTTTTNNYRLPPPPSLSLFHSLTLQLYLHLDDHFLLHHHHFISRFQSFISVISNPSLFNSSFSSASGAYLQTFTQFTHQPVNEPTSQSAS